MSVDDSFVPCRIDKPNPFEVLFALIYMGVGMFCLIAGLRRMERWEILFGFDVDGCIAGIQQVSRAQATLRGLLGVLQAVGSHPGS